MPAIRMHWNSSNDLYAWWEEQTKEHPLDGYAGPNNYDRGLVATGARRLFEGAPEYVKELERFSNAVWENVPTLQRLWRLQIVGAFPCVPAALAGYPESMFSLERDTNEHTPIRLWVGTTSAGGFSDEERIRRGAAIASFAQALGEVRPVLITPYAEMSAAYSNTLDQGSLISWDITSSPIILSEVAACLIAPRVQREFSMDVRLRLGNNGSTSHYPGQVKEDKIKRLLGVAEEDIWINSMYYGDPLLSDPIKWVKEHLEKYTSELEV